MHELDNVFWHALAGRQRSLTLGGEHARRYSPGLPGIVAFSDPGQPRWDELAPVCAAGERFYAADWTGTAPAGWQVEVEATLELMVWAAGRPEEEPIEAIPLGPAHADRMVALATLTKPGPFGPRNLELGDYFGVFEQGELVAMAGERMHAGQFREISAICTHPQWQGRGLARRLVQLMVGRQLRRGETPFLHVMSHNTGARQLYRRMGFELHRSCPARVVART